jgi:formylglycine-generating enzyme required for sulfatase activity
MFTASTRPKQGSAPHRPPRVRPLWLTWVLVFFLASCDPGTSEMVRVPEGEFLLGMANNQETLKFMSDLTAGMNARPQQKYYLPSFYIDRHEVTYQQFIRFKPKGRYEGGQAQEPVRGITWHEADAYCLWRGKRLPTEFEWEKAARGETGQLFTWGNDYTPAKTNLGRTVRPANDLPDDLSPYGVVGMNGNVSEWTASWYAAYPDSDMKDENFGETHRVIRGGSIQKREHGFLKEFAMLHHRNFAPPGHRFWDTGFRCARSDTGS